MARTRQQPELIRMLRTLAEGLIGVAVFLGMIAPGNNSISFAQQSATHPLFDVQTAPGVIGSTRLAQGGPVYGYYQPVEIRGPRGTQVCFAETGTFGRPRSLPVTAGLAIGQVYRFKVTNLPFPGSEGVELFPTLEVIDRLYPPPGQERQFPIIVELQADDLALALQGKFITRVIYLEDPQRALPAPAGGQQQPWFDVAPGQDPLQVADHLGRPVAILRMGGRVPLPDEQNSSAFLFGSPSLMIYPPQVKLLSGPPKEATATQAVRDKIQVGQQ